MQNIQLINLVIVGIMFSAAAVYLLRSDENRSKKLARIRVRVNDRDTRRMPEPQQEDYEPAAPGNLLIIGALLLLLVVVINGG